MPFEQDKYLSLVQKYLNNPRDFTDQDRAELIKQIIDYAIENKQSMQEAYEQLRQKYGLDPADITTIRKWRIDLCKKQLLTGEYCVHRVKRISGSRATDEEEEEEYEEEGDLTLTLTEKRELASLQKQYGEKYNLIGSIHADNRGYVFMNVRNFLLDPAIVIAYNRLRNIYIELPSNNGKPIKISLINLIVGAPPDVDVGIMSFINTVVINFLKIIGLREILLTTDTFIDTLSGVLTNMTGRSITPDEIREMMKTKFGVETPAFEEAFVYVRPRRRTEEEKKEEEEVEDVEGGDSVAEE